MANTVNINSGNWDNISGVFNSYINGGANVGVTDIPLIGPVIPTHIYHISAINDTTKTSGEGLYFTYGPDGSPWGDDIRIMLAPDYISAHNILTNNSANWNKSVIFDIR